MQYHIAVEGPAGNILIDWNNTRNWQQRYAAELDQAPRLSLIPCEGSRLPVVTVQLDPSRRWILFSRVVGRIDADGRRELRMYAIGWECGGVKSLTWVYPNGQIEVGDEPSYATAMLGNGR